MLEKLETVRHTVYKNNQIKMTNMVRNIIEDFSGIQILVKVKILIHMIHSTCTFTAMWHYLIDALL